MYGRNPSISINLPSQSIVTSIIITYTNDNEEPAEEIIHYTFGQEDADIKLIAPDLLSIGKTLFGAVAPINMAHGLECLLIWYMDDEVILEETIITGDDLPRISRDFEVSRDMITSVHLRAVLQHIAEDGDIHELTDEKTVILENNSKTYWMELEAERVAELVTSSYKGNRTLEWALENDYDDFDKEVFVNIVKGYESETEFLLWVNRTYQRTNVFKRADDGTWELIETFIIATGGPSTATRRGVSKIPSRTTAGWNFGDFKVEPVVRFYPGTRYAFHSRPLFPRSGEVKDERIGFPVSAGCVRMYCDDIWYIYHNIPDGTTVVIH